MPNLEPRTQLELHIVRQIRWLLEELKQLRAEGQGPQLPPPAGPTVAPQLPPPAGPAGSTGAALPVPADDGDYMRWALDDRNYMAWLEQRDREVRL